MGVKTVPLSLNVGFMWVHGDVTMNFGFGKLVALHSETDLQELIFENE